MSSLDVVYVIFFAVLGAVFASYLNVVALRKNTEISSAKGRSMCPLCGHILSPLDLVPVFSFLFLRGRCRYCKGKISPRYILAELSLAAAFAAAYLFSADLITAVLICAFAAALLLVTLFDISTGEIPDSCSIFIAALALARLAADGFTPWASRLFGAVIAALPLLLFALALGAFGGGDIKLMAAAGVFLGAKAAAVALFAGILLGGAAAIALLLKDKTKKGATMPFGPYLSIGCFFAALFGERIVDAYLRLF